MGRISKAFGEQVRQVLANRGWSHLRANVASSIPSATIGRMALGIVPGSDHVIAWAKALKEPINKWLDLAGYDPIPENLISVRPDPMIVREQMAEYLVETGRLTSEEAAKALSELQEESAAADMEHLGERKSA